MLRRQRQARGGATTGKNGLLLVLTLMSGVDVINSLLLDYSEAAPYSYYFLQTCSRGVALYFIVTAVRKGRRLHAKESCSRRKKPGKMFNAARFPKTLCPQERDWTCAVACIRTLLDIDEDRYVRNTGCPRTPTTRAR